MILNNTEVRGDKLIIDINELKLQLKACIDTQIDAKEKNDFTTWLIAAGHIEAIKDLLSYSEQ